MEPSKCLENKWMNECYILDSVYKLHESNSMYSDSGITVHYEMFDYLLHDVLLILCCVNILELVLGQFIPALLHHLTVVWDPDETVSL